ncbi:nuclear transport factor 2 family protein [Crocosphaera sp.]|uniref:nuclear transport factor 2 family protein n=1 Tax=Crocosphaera sp. TaxID=2729996 RepID=UPI00260878DF|nr:nuclear transport factor 2 family protein [Crocosphaera sp.]MDJ0581605.1 nuclear transport factor 2 family protein [Crocosphaera sp.]
MELNEQHVRNAYAALATGEKAKIQEYWADDMIWLVPGHNIISGWKNNLDEFIEFMTTVGQLSDNSFQMVHSAIMTTGEYSADVSRNTGHRAGNPDKALDINVIHFLRWRDGKVIEGRGAIFADGTAEYDKFWSPV